MRPLLRKAKSSATLRQDRPPSPPPPLPGFVTETVPPPPYQQSQNHLSPNNHREQPELRRARSSSALDIPPLPPRPTTASGSASREASPFRKALDDAQYFASGLITKPYVTSKHFSIVRHSSAVIWYRGPTTSIAITIFSSTPVPPGRTLWLQQRGHSGNMGMALKAMVGNKSSWIDVTPVRETAASNIDAADERAYQRDIRRVLAKVSNHHSRETHILRIPSSCQDGYFRLVLCHDTKVLCGSPVFRLASTSSDMSSLRGASITTAPLEMGVKVASTIGQQTIRKYTGVAGLVVGKAMGNKGKLVSKMAFGSAGEVLTESRRARYERLLGENMLADRLLIIGSPEGPEGPYPIYFSGQVQLGTGQTLNGAGYPTANVHAIPAHIAQLDGVYAAWISIDPDEWVEGVVSMLPTTTSRTGVVSNNYAATHILRDLDGISLVGTKIRIALMGCIRASSYSGEPTDLAAQHAQDVSATLTTLALPAWSASAALSKIKEAKRARTFTDRVAETADRVPLHWAGVRSQSALVQEASMGVGGVYIVR
ncbi:hypothetical protein VHEMI02494 [[Torrubiella] hemipterigena]|uniref:Riboflavin kinase n=1 Tax=[Torrubiella] hemipterigena TaxID=1531966 RepID=A0A0A1SVX0_9HYPO|nr:hypothetical protein VHEMI02494 [[Torrubiella] hemipterigena]